MKNASLLIVTVLAAASAVLGAGRAATKPATAASKPAASAENAGALYQKIVADYLGADWVTLEDDLGGHSGELAAMNKEQKDDVAYIRQALIDGRGAIGGTGWWDMIKAGKTASTRPVGMAGGAALAATAGRGTLFHTPVWGHNVTFAFDGTLSGSVQMSTMGANNIILTLNWPVADMDSKDQAEHGFTKGDLDGVGIWQVIAQADVFQSFSGDKLKSLTQDEQAKLADYMMFRGDVTAAYYGTPRTRRWAIFLSCDGYTGDHKTDQAFIDRRPLAVFVMEELAAHPAKYPSIHLPANVRENNAETSLAVTLMGVFEKTTLTLAEDKALRDAIKEFATPNQGTVFSGGKITMPGSKLTMMFAPTADGDSAAKRNAWLVQQLTPGQGR